MVLHAVLKERLPKEVRLNGTCISGADDDRNDRVLLRVVMCRLRYFGTDVRARCCAVVRRTALERLSLNYAGWRPQELT